MDTFKVQFPDFHLEDNVSFAEGGIVRPQSFVHTIGGVKKEITRRLLLQIRLERLGDQWGQQLRGL